MRHRIGFAATALAAIGALLLTSSANASTSGVSHYKTGDKTVSGLTVYWKFGCTDVVDKHDADGNQAIFYRPSWDFKVVEHGQTSWKYVRLGYMWFIQEETWYYNVARGVWDLDAPPWYQVFNIESAKSTKDPVKVVGPSIEASFEGGELFMLTDHGKTMWSEGATGLQFEASKDGKNWTPLAGAYGWEGGTLRSPTMFGCAYRPYP
jgi:hypothetical protein